MNQNLKFHVFETRTSNKIGRFMGLNAIFNKIQKGDHYTEAIEAIRNKGRKHPDYENIIDGRESITWNACSEISKSSDTKAMQGILHMCKDDCDANMLKTYIEVVKQTSFVIAAWKNMEGTGIDCLIRCDEVSANNFEELFEQINHALEIDFACKAMADLQPRPISYDPNIYINFDATNYGSQANTLLQAISNSLQMVSDGSIGKVHNDISNTEERLRLAPQIHELSRDNVRYKSEYLDEFFEGVECKQSIEGFPYLAINRHYKVTGDKRQATMYHQAGKLIWLNPLQDEAYLVKLLYEINFYQCKPRLPYWEIRKILLEQYQRYQNEELDPKFKIRYTVCKHDTTLTLKERQQLNVKMNHVIRTTKTYNIIREELKRLMDAGVKILQVDLIKISTKAERTVKEYWKRYFKAEVEQYNQKLEIM